MLFSILLLWPLFAKIFDITVGKFLHLTDLHIDPYYRTGSSVKSICHRFEDNVPTAGYFGDRKCDTPVRTARHLLRHIRDRHMDFDFIILTGDLARHDTEPEILPKTRKEIYQTSLMVRSALNKYFPAKPVIFTIGNNDLFEHDQLVGGHRSLDLKLHFIIWRHYVPRDQWATFANYGYYKITGYYYPLDIIALNTMLFYEPNKMVQDCSEPGSAGRKHLKWLKKQLVICRKRSAYAYLIGHVAPNSGQYYRGCLRKFVQLTNKFSDVIHTQLYGHSNYDDFFTDQPLEDVKNSTRKKKKKGIFGLIAPSVVPLFNPAFRMMSYERSEMHFGRLTDYEQYYMDLDEANHYSPKVRLEYTAQDAYGLGPLNLRYFRRLKQRISLDSSLRDKYKLYRVVSCRDCLDE